MIVKSVPFSLGLMALISTTPLIAEDYADICGSRIEGVDVTMSKSQVSATWADKGYVLVQDSDKQKKAPTKPIVVQMLLFQTSDRLPNADFINTVGWQRNVSTGVTKIFASYVAPEQLDQLQAYEAFYRSKLVAYCTEDIDALRAAAPAASENSRFSRSNPNPMPPTLAFCEKALNGEFRVDDNGHATTPPNALHLTDTQGCRVSYGNLNLRGFTSGFRLGIEQTP